MKTIKFLKMAGLVTILVLATNFAYSTSGEATRATQELHQSISDAFNKNISQTGNYLYENHIYKLNDKVEVTFRVKENRELEVLNVKCKNCDGRVEPDNPLKIIVHKDNNCK